MSISELVNQRLNQGAVERASVPLRTTFVLRRQLLFPTAAAPLAVVAGCGLGRGQETVKSPTNLPASALEFWPLGEGEAVDKLMARFKSYAPQITISRVDGGDLTKVLAAAAAGTPPDIAGSLISWVGTLYARGVAEPAARVLKGLPGWQPEGFNAGLRAVLTYGGDLVTVPYVINATPLAVNLDLLERANLSPPPATWNWDQLADYATRLTVRRGSEVTQWGFASAGAGDATATNDFNTLLWSFGGTMLDPSGQRSAFQGPEGQAALDWLVGLMQRKQAAPYPYPPEWNQSPNAMLGARGQGFVNASSGGTAIIPYETGTLKALTQYATFRWQTVVPPRNKKFAANASSGSWYMCKGAPHRAAAVAFVHFVGLAEQMAQWALDQERLPPHEGAAARPEWQAYLKNNPHMQVHMETLKGAVLLPSVPGWADVRTAVLGAALADAFSGKVTPRAALEDAARQADAIFVAARAG